MCSVSGANFTLKNPPKRIIITIELSLHSIGSLKQLTVSLSVTQFLHVGHSVSIFPKFLSQNITISLVNFTFFPFYCWILSEESRTDMNSTKIRSKFGSFEQFLIRAFFPFFHNMYLKFTISNLPRSHLSTPFLFMRAGIHSAVIS